MPPCNLWDMDVLCGLIYVALFIWNVDIDQWKGQEAKATGPNLQLVAYVVVIWYCFARV